MSISDFVNTLERKNQIELAIELIEIGLPVWENYNTKNQIEYTDSVVGMYHKIDKKLIHKSIRLLKRINKKNTFLMDKIYGIKFKNLKKEIREPIVARQDNDFELPETVELILFSTSNLIDYATGIKVNHANENLASVSINQSIEAIIKCGILDYDEIKRVLNKKLC